MRALREGKARVGVAALRPWGVKTAGEILVEQVPASADVLAASLPLLPDATLAEVPAAPACGAAAEEGAGVFPAVVVAGLAMCGRFDALRARPMEEKPAGSCANLGNPTTPAVTLWLPRSLCSSSSSSHKVTIGSACVLGYMGRSLGHAS